MIQFFRQITFVIQFPILFGNTRCHDPGGLLPANSATDEDLQAPLVFQGDQAHPQRQTDQHIVEHRRHAKGDSSYDTIVVR